MSLTQPAPVVLAFSGAVPVFGDAVLQLAEAEPGFRDTLRCCASIVFELAGWSLFAELERSRDSHPVVDFSRNTPLFLAVQIALLHLLRQDGLGPHAALGLSGGEVTAAYAAGMIDLATAMRIAVAIPATLERRARGLRMATVDDPPTELPSCLAADVVIAASMTPRTITLSGPDQELGLTLDRLVPLGAQVRLMPFGWGVHHPSLRLDADRFHHLLGAIQVAPPNRIVQFCSTAGDPRESLRNRGIWTMVSEPVRFQDAVTRLQQQGLNQFVSVGLGASLTGLLVDLGGQCTAFHQAHVALREQSGVLA